MMVLGGIVGAAWVLEFSSSGSPDIPRFACQMVAKSGEDCADLVVFHGIFLIPPGNLLHSELENHHFSWENPLFRLGHFQ